MKEEMKEDLMQLGVMYLVGILLIGLPVFYLSFEPYFKDIGMSGTNFILFFLIVSSAIFIPIYFFIKYVLYLIVKKFRPENIRGN